MNTQPPDPCQHCKFWTPWPKQPSSEGVYGDCRRHAPQIFHTRQEPQDWRAGVEARKPKKEFATKFPSTEANEFCGSFKPRVSFPAWFAKLKEIVRPYYSLTDNDADAWRSEFEDGKTPQEALQDDLQNG